MFLKLRIQLGLISMFILMSILDSHAQTDFNKLRHELAIAKKDTEKAIVIQDLGFEFMHNSMFDSTQKYIQLGFVLAAKIPDKKYLAAFYQLQGNLYKRQGNAPKCLEAFQKAYKLYTPTQEENKAILAYNMSGVYLNTGEHKKAVESMMIALKYDEAHPSAGLAPDYIRIGEIYTNLHNTPLSITFYKKALNIANKYNSSRDQSSALLGLGAANLSLNKYEEAITYYNQALSIDRKSNYKDRIAANLNNIGTCLQNLGRFDEALKFHTESLSIRLIINSPEPIMSCYYQLAMAYNGVHQYTQALRYAEKADSTLKTNKSYSNTELALELTKLLSELYQKEHKYKEAFSYYQQSVKTKDSLYNKDQLLTIEKIRNTYEIEKRQNQIDLLHKSNQLQALTLAQEKQENGLLLAEKENNLLRNNNLQKDSILKAKQILLQKANLSEQKQSLEAAKTFRLYMLGGLGVILLILAILYNNYIRQRKAKELLAIKNSEIEQQAKELAVLNEQKVKLFSILGHDLRSPIANLQSLLGAFNHEVGLKDKNHVTQNLYQQVGVVYSTLDNLLHWSMLQINQAPTILQQISLKDNVEQCVELLSEDFKNKAISIIDKMENCTVLANEIQLQIVLRNLLSNAIKFTHPKGFIKLSTKEVGECICFTITDTGVGMSDEMVATIFDTDYKSSLGTSGEKGTGLGMKLCKDLIEKQGGTIQITSKINQGTTITITLKKV